MSHRWDPIAPTPQVSWPVPVDPRGEHGPTRGQAAGPRWRRSSTGLHVPAQVTDDLPEQRILEQAVRLPAGGVVTGWAGCRLWGARFLDGLAPDGRTRLPVPLALGPRGGMRRDSRISLSFERLPPWEVTTRHGIPVARPERCVFDEVRARGEREGLVALEAALAGRITSLSRLRAYAASHRSARRAAVVWWALARASEHVLSPQETRARTIAEENAGRARLLVNHTLWSLAGQRLGQVDLLDEEAGQGIEVDGAEHRSPARHAADVGKEDRLRRVDVELVRVTGTCLRDERALVERLVVARRRASYPALEARRWRAVPPGLDLEGWLRHREDRELWRTSGW